MSEQGAGSEAVGGASNAVLMHYVSTLREARELVDANDSYWVCNCGCREGNEDGCKRSRVDVCLMFRDSPASGSEKRAITRDEVEEILKEAESCGLVARPFRSEDRSFVEGICFCCDDCCGYFVENDEACDKGGTMERTDMEACTDCGACVPACHFHVREMRDDRLVIARERCYGCGLCVEACPERCVELVIRC
ncbi:MAG: 4Fe-4S binding protein [Candidatus Eisenbacteria bacterium]